DARRFTKMSLGQLTQTIEGNPAFVPKPAPRDLALSGDAVALLDEGSNRLGVVEGIARRLPNPELLIAPYLRCEAVLSSRIEGTERHVRPTPAPGAEGEAARPPSLPHKS